MHISLVEKWHSNMGPNTEQHEADQDRVLADLSGQPTGLIRTITGRSDELLIVLWAGLKELRQRMRPKHLPTKQHRLWSQSPHH
jgi:hypothetical protein